MTVSSAEPDKLQAFVDRTSAGRAGAQIEQRGVASQHAVVRGASPDFGVDAPVVTVLADSLTAMHDNERFVATIGNELLAADLHRAGPIAVSDGSLRASLDVAGVGSPPPRRRFEPTTMYGLPPTSGFVDDPICAANGNMVHQDFDLVFPGIAASLDLVRTYNSLLSERVGAFGRGWTSMLDVRLDALDGRVEVHLPDGATAAFVSVDGEWRSAGRRLRALSSTETGWAVAVDDLHTYRFDHGGRLAGWHAGTARVTVTRDGDRIVRVDEARSGRWYAIEWSDTVASVVSRVVTNDGRWVAYLHDDQHQLIRASSPAGHLDYEWVAGFLVAVVDADGVRPFRNEYDTDGRVTCQTSPFGRVTEYRYDSEGLTVVTDGHGVRQAMVHDERGNLTAVVDIDGSAMRLAYDHLDRVVAVTDRTGATWAYRFDPVDAVDRLLERVDPDGVSERWEWDASGRVTGHTDRGGAVTTFEYRDALRSPVRIVGPGGEVTTAEIDDRFDVPLSITDGEGLITRFEYDADGQPVAATDGHGRCTTFEFDPAGRLTACRDAAGMATTITHDHGGRIVAHQRAGAITTYARTAAGRVCGGIEPGGVGWSATFAAHGAPVAVTDALGATLRFGYDAIGNVTKVVAPDGASYRQEYDEIGRLVAVVDPAGGTTRQHYDRAGNLVGIVDPAGRTARREVDVFGRTVRSIAPDGAATEFAYHATGEIAAVTGPDGRTWRSEREGAESRMAIVGAVARTSANVERDGAGRVLAVTDGTGACTRYRYDGRGLLVGAVDPAGGRTDYGYDVRGRLIAQAVPGGRTSSWSYDAVGRVDASVDPAGVTTRIEREPGGFVTGLSRGSDGWQAELDRVGREVRRVAFDGSIMGEYQYDACGRLVAASAASGWASQFLWDDDDRLIAVVDTAGAPDGGSAAAQRDRAGRLLLGNDGTAYEYDRAGRLSRIAGPDGNTVGFEYGRDGLIASEHHCGLTRRFTYDAAGRVASITVDGGPSTRFEYDDAGRRVAELCSDGSEVHYRWSGLDRLTEIVRVAPGGECSTEAIEVDALGRLRRVGGRVVEHDRASGRWRHGMPEGPTVGTLTFLGARVLDRASSQFLTPDPLLTVPGSNGAGSAYTYAWNDPVNFVDPTGMRPISRAEWNAIREREEQGRLGQAWQALEADPWGSLTAGVVIAAGAVLCVTPLAPVGVGIMIGAGIAAGTGLATGALDARQIALGGLLGGISGGAGAANLSAARSIGLGLGIGGGSDLGTQLMQPGPVDWQSVLVNGAVGGLTGGIGYRMGGHPTTTAARSALVGGATEGSGAVVRQALTGDHTVDLRQVAFEAAGGAASSVANDHFSLPPSARSGELLELPALSHELDLRGLVDVTVDVTLDVTVDVTLDGTVDVGDPPAPAHAEVSEADPEGSAAWSSSSE